MSNEAKSVGEQFRAANQILAAGGNENTMAPLLVDGLSQILPKRLSITFDRTRDGSRDRPDFTVLSAGAAVAYIEAKRPATLTDAFALDTDGRYQVERYRGDGLPVFLTDGLRWFDVTDPDRWNLGTFPTRVQSPFASFDEASRDEQSSLSLKTMFDVALEVRPHYSSKTAPLAMLSVINRINSAENQHLEGAWEAAKHYLRSSSEPEELGDGRVGELIAFTLLAVAASLEPLDPQSFVSAARSEWQNNRSWKSGDLPSALRSALNDFRRVDGESGDSLLGELGWVMVRSVAATNVRKDGIVGWDQLSALWDNYLGVAGQRVKLGSWQTPSPVARLQAQQVSLALQNLGYQGFSDPAVTTIDPCCGTGVYLQEVIAQTEREGGTAASLSASGTQHARIIGSDISPTAVAATHIRIASLGVSPNLYMADTLSASPESGSVTGRADASEMLGLFTLETEGFDAALVQAVKHDHRELSAWAGRDGKRDPVVAVIGNPPYGRSSLNPENYKDRSWYVECFNQWRKGSGGRGSLQDPFVGFMAWAFRLCQLPHNAIACEPPFGVVSFIANRSWISGDTFGPFRKWLRSQAASVVISDFGPGSRGAVANRWSQQPFAIETGTAIMTVTFDPSSEDNVIEYRRAFWEDNQVIFRESAVTVESDEDWTGKAASKVLFKSGQWMNGVKTATDRKWIKTEGDRAFGTRHAYRAFDNRYSPTSAPSLASPGSQIKDAEASPQARWNSARLFTPHRNPSTRPDWYLIGQSKSAKPGPALHATKNLPDYHFFKGSEGGRVLPISSQTPIPQDFQGVAKHLSLESSDFWLVTLAVAHHSDYWTEDTDLAKQLADVAVEPPYPSDSTLVERLLEIGEELVALWSMDHLEPVAFRGTPGSWKFDGHLEAESAVVHGRKVLEEWRKARPGDWDRATAEEYARTIAAVSRTVELSFEVKSHLGSDVD